MFFMAGGSNFFQLPKGKVTSNMVETQRKIYNGNFEFTVEQKQSFHPVNIDGLIVFFQSGLDRSKIKELMREFAIPDELTTDSDLFFKALALQFEAFVHSSSQEAGDIVLMQYQHLLENGDVPSELPIRAKYPYDQVLISPNQTKTHQVTAHDRNIVHEWIIQNRWTKTWTGRKLYFLNHDEVKPRAASNYVDIPDTPPGEYVHVKISMDARRYEGTTRCHWIMLDSQGDDCFPNSNTFDFTLVATFVYEPKNMEVKA